MHRRDVLAGVAGLAAAGVTGCLGPDGSTPTGTAFEVVDRACGSGRNAATVTFGDDAVHVEGIIGGRNTCDTARLVSAELHLDGLEVAVEVVEQEAPEPRVCAQCLTDIEYVLDASGRRGRAGRVRVVHRTADGERTVAEVDRP